MNPKVFSELRQDRYYGFPIFLLTWGELFDRYPRPTTGQGGTSPLCMCTSVAFSLTPQGPSTQTEGGSRALAAGVGVHRHEAHGRGPGRQQVEVGERGQRGGPGQHVVV